MEQKNNIKEYIEKLKITFFNYIELVTEYAINKKSKFKNWIYSREQVPKMLLIILGLFIIINLALYPLKRFFDIKFANRYKVILYAISLIICVIMYTLICLEKNKLKYKKILDNLYSNKTTFKINDLDMTKLKDVLKNVDINKDLGQNLDNNCSQNSDSIEVNLN